MPKACTVPVAPDAGPRGPKKIAQPRGRSKPAEHKKNRRQGEFPRHAHTPQEISGAVMAQGPFSVSARGTDYRDRLRAVRADVWCQRRAWAGDGAPAFRPNDGAGKETTTQGKKKTKSKWRMVAWVPAGRFKHLPRMVNRSRSRTRAKVKKELAVKPQSRGQIASSRNVRFLGHTSSSGDIAETLRRGEAAIVGGRVCKGRPSPQSIPPAGCSGKKTTRAPVVQKKVKVGDAEECGEMSRGRNRCR